MKLNFMTDQGSNRDTIRCACRAGVPSFWARCAFARLGTDCGLGIRAAADCQADGRSGRSPVVSGSSGCCGCARTTSAPWE